MSRRGSLLLMLALPAQAALAQIDHDAQALLVVEAEDLRADPQASFASAPVSYFLHRGEFDLFTLGDLAVGNMRSFVNEGSPVEFALMQDLQLLQPTGRMNSVIMFDNHRLDGSNAWIGGSLSSYFVDRTEHSHLSYVMKVHPSNDAFVGNDEPRRHRLFDEAGRFVGPVVIDVLGDDVLDGGTRENDETDLLLLDRWLDELDPELGVRTEEPIARHPGFNGSFRNPGGEPQRILGGSATFGPAHNPIVFDYDEEAADFSRPGFRIMRLRVTSGLHWGYNGTYYDPQRSGEGVTFEVSGEDSRTLTMVWYTYDPAGSGEPLYLFGAGRVVVNAAEIDLYRSRGGRLASFGNPADVEAEPWGRVRVAFGEQCRFGAMEVLPNDPETAALPELQDLYYFLRLTPLTADQQRVCGHVVIPEAPFGDTKLLEVGPGARPYWFDAVEVH